MDNPGVQGEHGDVAAWGGEDPIQLTDFPFSILEKKKVSIVRFVFYYRCCCLRGDCLIQYFSSKENGKCT